MRTKLEVSSSKYCKENGKFAKLCPSNMKSVSIAIPETWTKFLNLKVGRGDLDYDYFDILLSCSSSTSYSLSTC